MNFIQIVSCFYTGDTSYRFSLLLLFQKAEMMMGLAGLVHLVALNLTLLVMKIKALSKLHRGIQLGI